VLGATYLFIGFLATAQSWPIASILAFGFYAVLGGIVGLLVGALLHANAFLVLTRAGGATHDRTAPREGDR
jgi:hypothetical protein